MKMYIARKNIGVHKWFYAVCCAPTIGGLLKFSRFVLYETSVRVVDSQPMTFAGVLKMFKTTPIFAHFLCVILSGVTTRNSTDELLPIIHSLFFSRITMSHHLPHHESLLLAL